MSKKLHNSLIDYLVAVGCDRDSGLVFKDKQCLNDENFYQIITNPIDPTILSVISGDLANYPASQNKINLNYPPLKLIRDVSFDLGNIEQNAKTKRDHYHRLSNIMSFESPIHADILQNLPQFCFPNKCYASKLYIKPSIHSFVLTDIEGRKKYSIVLIYYREFYCSKNKDNFELLESDEDAEEKRNYFHVYIPTAIILISQFSYFTILKECLSCIYDSLIKTESFQATLENFAFRLTHLPVPPKRFNRFNLILETCLYKEKIISIHPQDEFEYEVFDLSLKFLFNHMSIENIIHVILGCLSESKILFISQDYRILTPVIQCLMKLIQPFKWLLAYVPLLPGPQLGYIEAPHPFIMGYCTDYENLIKQMEEDNEIMIIDLNNDEIISKRKLNNFPDNCTNLLKSKLLSIDLNYVENQKLCRITKTDLYSLERMEESLIRKLNFKICDAFLEFYVNIFGDLTLFIKKQTKKFNKIAYLDTINEKDLPFYKQVIDSSIFGFFINSFIKNITEEKPDLYNHKLKTMKSKLEKKDSKYEKLEYEVLDLINNFEKQITKIFQIPDNCAKIIEEITKDLETTHLLPYKDSLYYLRGFFYISINQIKDGFRDLYQIDSKSLFPKDIIQDYILPTLSPNQIEMFQEQN
ncbi:unnamed protein product [Brachionus calyciflorus]|uniref:UDENN domain-containing protein n=1 Tax=Brachionus calyciflorus TaxID=104777 RepID=A0A813NW42_9BILA|nr:unnamed protein product [Brachionus calyciflorus]